MPLTLVRRNKTWHVGGTNDFGVKIPRHSTKVRDEGAAQEYRRRMNALREWSKKALKETLYGPEPEAHPMSLWNDRPQNQRSEELTAWALCQIAEALNGVSTSLDTVARRIGELFPRSRP
jgi:hypothetical protein